MLANRQQCMKYCRSGKCGVTAEENQQSYDPMKPDSAPFSRSDIKGRSETMSAIFDWALLNMEVLRSGAERHANKVVRQLFFEAFHLEAGQNKLKTVTSCSEVVRESSTRMLDNEKLVKKEMRIDGKLIAGESVLATEEGG